MNLLSSSNTLRAPKGPPHGQVLLLAHVPEKLGPFSCKGPIGPLVMVAKNVFVLECTSNVTLVRPQPPVEVAQAQGPVLGDGNGLGFNFVHFRVGYLPWYPTFWLFSQKLKGLQ